MIPFDRFLGLTGMRSTGAVLDAGTHLRWGYSLYSGYPPFGFTLFRISLRDEDSNVTQSFDFANPHDGPQIFEVSGSNIDAPQDVFLFHSGVNTAERGMLLCDWQRLDLGFSSGVRGLQMVLFGLGGPVEIEIEQASGTTNYSVDMKNREMRPFYFESESEIQRVSVNSSAALLLELELLRYGWPALKPIEIARLYLPGDQAEIDSRLSAMPEADRKVEIDGFKWVRDKLSDPSETRAPIDQTSEQPDLASTGDSPKSIALLNPHDLLATMALRANVARATGVYFVDRLDQNEQYGYLLGGHWRDKSRPDGFVALTGIQLIDTLAFPAPTGFTAQAINGSLQAAPSGTDKSGVVGIGLKWDLPERILGSLQNHPVYYQVSRAGPATGNSLDREIICGASQEGSSLVESAYQLADFGTDSPLDGTYSYGLRGVDLFGRVSASTAAGPVTVDTFTIPPSPVDLEAKITPAGLEVKFSWTARQQAGDSELGLFSIYDDSRQLVPLTGEVVSFNTGGGQTILEIAPDDSSWDDGASFVGGMVQMSGEFHQILAEDSRLPLQVRVPAIGSGSFVGERCTISSNWRDSGLWDKTLATVSFEPAPETGSIAAISAVSGNDDQRQLTFAATAFSGRSDVDAATVVQDGVEYHVRPDPSTPGGYFLEGTQDDGNRTFPSTGPVLVYPRITVSVPGFTINDVVPGAAARKRFAVGVSATDLATDGSNEGPVSPRYLITWMEDSALSGPSYSPVPTMTAVTAERADADGISTYTFAWPPIPGETAYFVFRASEETLIAIDKDRTGESLSHYQGLSLFELWQLAGTAGNERSFQRLTSEAWTPEYSASGDVAYVDRTLPGRSSARYFYRVQPIGANNTVGDFSDVFQPVICPPARPPSQPGVLLVRTVGNDVYLYWEHSALADLDYYVVYRTQDPDTANDGLWRRFDHAVKVNAGDSPKPLVAEFGLVDISSLPGGRSATPLGVFSRNDYETQFGTDVSFASAEAALTNLYGGIFVSGRLSVDGLSDHTSVVCFYEIGGAERIAKDFEGQKMARDTVPSSGTYYHCVAAVDTAGNISSLSRPSVVVVGG